MFETQTAALGFTLHCVGLEPALAQRTVPAAAAFGVPVHLGCRSLMTLLQSLSSLTSCIGGKSMFGQGQKSCNISSSCYLSSLLGYRSPKILLPVTILSGGKSPSGPGPPAAELLPFVPALLQQSHNSTVLSLEEICSSPCSCYLLSLLCCCRGNGQNYPASMSTQGPNTGG